MKKSVILKKSVAVALVIIAFFVSSCSNDKDATAELRSPQTKKEMNEALTECFAKTLSGSDSRGDGLVDTVFIDFGHEGGEPGFELIDEFTGDDLINAAINFGAEFSLEDDGMRDTAIVISQAQAKESLIPMVQFSRRYLISRGLTDDEINEIVNEVGVEEEALIPLVMLFSSVEELEEQTIIANRSAAVSFPLSILAMPAYAWDVPWGKLKNCILEAFGVRELWDYFTKNTQVKLTKMVVKTCLRKVAPKFLGYVGTAIALIDFAVCMSE